MVGPIGIWIISGMPLRVPIYNTVNSITHPHRVFQTFDVTLKMCFGL